MAIMASVYGCRKILTPPICASGSGSCWQCDFRTRTTDPYPDLTPVNATRAVLNRAIGTSLPKVADQSFFATWSRPFELIEVTDRLRAMR